MKASSDPSPGSGPASSRAPAEPDAARLSSSKSSRPDAPPPVGRFTIDALKGVKRVEPSMTGESGRATLLRIHTAYAKPFDVPVETFRRALDLPAAPLEVREIGPKVVEFAGRGEGPGAGLCQIGAEEMARERSTHEAILRHYFPGAVLAKLPYAGRDGRGGRDGGRAK